MGDRSFAELSELIGSLDLFPTAAPERDVSRAYRRWAFESAALDLALRQASTTLAAALGREARPLTFVSSMRLSPFGSEQPPRSSRCSLGSPFTRPCALSSTRPTTGMTI